MANNKKPINYYDKKISEIFPKLLSDDNGQARKKLSYIDRSLRTRLYKSEGEEKHKLYKKIKGIRYLSKGINILNFDGDDK